MLDSAHRYFAGWRGDEFIGYCCFGSDARVPGGNYTRGEPEVLDVGGGLRPDLVGRGMGEGLVRQVLAFACERFRPQSLRVTALSSNPRARALCRRLGFRGPAILFNHLKLISGDKKLQSLEISKLSNTLETANRMGRDNAWRSHAALPGDVVAVQKIALAPNFIADT
jgi:RimJ/RimL family protein N-acetyltransferase